MTRFLVERQFEVGQEQMVAVGRRSREIAEESYPSIVWEHSHVIVDDEGLVRTFCVYEAPNEEIVREHSSRLGQHRIDSLDEIIGDVTPADFPAV